MIFFSFMGMCSDAAPDVIMRHSYGVYGVKRTDLIAKRHHQPEHGRTCPNNYPALIAGTLLRVEVNMAIDQLRKGVQAIC